MPEFEETGLDDGTEAFINGPNYSQDPVPVSPADEDNDAEDTAESQDAEPATDADTETDTETTEESEQKDTEEADTEAAEVSAAEVDRLIQKFAKETGLNLKDPSQLKTLNRLAQKEVHILRQNQRIQDLEARTTTAQQDTTDAETQIFDRYKGEEEAKQAPATSAAPEAGEKPLWQQWQSPEDAYQAVTKAWGEGKRAPDYKEVEKVDRNLFQMRLVRSLPLVEHVARQVLQETFGDLMPDIQATVQQKRVESARTWAVGALTSEKGFEDIESIFKADADQPLVVNGEKYDNTPMNRILLDNPEIMDIHVTEHNGKRLSEADALKATFIKRYKIISKMAKSGKIDGKQAKELVEAGAKMGKRSQGDKLRQEMNSGSSARKTQTEERYGQFLAKNSRGGVGSLSDL